MQNRVSDVAHLNCVCLAISQQANSSHLPDHLLRVVFGLGFDDVFARDSITYGNAVVINRVVGPMHFECLHRLVVSLRQLTSDYAGLYISPFWGDKERKSVEEG